MQSDFSESSLGKKTNPQGSHKLWKNLENHQKSSMHGKLMEFEKKNN